MNLLAPGPAIGKVVPVGELGSHAQTVPFLEFLTEEPVQGILLSPSQVVPVNLPAPERFVLHKLYASQSRAAQRDKTRKDLEQAAALAAVLEEDMPGRLTDAFRVFPREGKSAMRRGALAASKVAGMPAEAANALKRISG